MLCIRAWTFTTLPEKYILTVPLLIVIHIVMGISMAGIALASGTIGLKLHELISEGKRPVRKFSTAGGLRYMVHFPFAIVRNTYVKARAMDNRRNRQWKQ